MCRIVTLEKELVSLGNLIKGRLRLHDNYGGCCKRQHEDPLRGVQRRSLFYGSKNTCLYDIVRNPEYKAWFHREADERLQ